MVTHEEMNRIVDTVLDYFKIDINSLSLTDAAELYRQCAHACGLK